VDDGRQFRGGKSGIGGFHFLSDQHIFYLINTENQARWHIASGYFPIRQSSIDLLESEGWFEANPAFHIPLDQILGVEPNPANAGAAIGAYIQVRTAVGDAIISMIDGGESPEDVLEAAQARANQAIAEYNAVIGG
jgi:sn-glycerol 3-phosphate transport system substrate-binding protein